MILTNFYYLYSMKRHSKSLLPFALAAAVVLAGCIKMTKGGETDTGGPDGPDFPPPLRWNISILSGMNTVM